MKPNVIVTQESPGLFSFDLDGWAQVWVQENVPDALFAGDLLMVDGSCAFAIMHGMCADGLVLSDRDGRIFTVEPA